MAAFRPKKSQVQTRLRSMNFDQDLKFMSTCPPGETGPQVVGPESEISGWLKDLKPENRPLSKI